MSDAATRALLAVERAHMAVRRNPRQPVRLEAAAKEAGYSASRLHAVFSRRYGETFGAFVRRARLEQACGLMRAHSDWPLTRVALEAGYSESSDFTRSFKRAFGLPPNQWDRVTPLSSGFEKEKNRQAKSEEPCDNAIVKSAPERTGRDWPVRIEDRPPQTVAVFPVPQAEDPERLNDGWKRFEDWLSRQGQLRPDRMMMGLSYDSHYDSPAGAYRFELAQIVDEETQASHGVVTRELPATRAAVLSCHGGLAEFSLAWDHLGRIFMSESPWEPGPGPALEIYYEDPRPSGMTLWNMDCVLPIQRSGGVRDDA